MGLKLHGDSSHKQLINLVNAFGISVNYDRVIEIKRSMARGAIKQFDAKGVVIPTNIRSGVFVTFDVDNLDNHNKSNLSQFQFHRTAISVTNHLSWVNLGLERPSIQLDQKTLSALQLPGSYSVVKSAGLTSNTQYVPRTPNLNCRAPQNLLHEA